MQATEALDLRCSRAPSPTTSSPENSTLFDISTVLLASLEDLPYPHIQWEGTDNDDCSVCSDHIEKLLAPTSCFAKRRRTSKTGMIRSKEVSNLDLLQKEWNEGWM